MACCYQIELPIKDRNGNPIKVDCGHCLSCLIAKQTYLEFITKKELLEYYKKGQGASFVTLTYNEDNLPLIVPKELVKNETYEKIKQKDKEREDIVIVRPKNIKNDITLIKVMQTGINTLVKKDLQKTLKRMRRNMQYVKYNNDFKTIYCGEYGDTFGRSHYHLILLGICQEEAKQFLLPAWKNQGMIDIGVLAPGGLRYVINYVSKNTSSKEEQKIYEEKGVQKPFIYHSVNMGKKWLLENADKLIKNNFLITSNEKQILAPKKIIKYICAIKGINDKYFYNKYFREKDKETENIRENKTLEQWLYDEKLLKEMQNYEAIRSQSERPISPKYIVKMQEGRSYFRPKSQRYFTKENCKNNYSKEIIRRIKISDTLQAKKGLKEMLEFFSQCAEK